MVSFKIATVKRITCAAPDYILEHGEPITPEQLTTHKSLLYRRAGRFFDQWHYSNLTNTYKIKVESNRVSNDTDIVKRWAVAGKGIAYRSYIDIYSELKNGQLVQLLPNYESPTVELHLICPSREQITPAVIALRELLRSKLSANVFAP